MDHLRNMRRRFVIEMLKRRMLLLDEMVMHLGKVVINETCGRLRKWAGIQYLCVFIRWQCVMIEYRVYTSF